MLEAADLPHGRLHALLLGLHLRLDLLRLLGRAVRPRGDQVLELRAFALHLRVHLPVRLLDLALPVLDRLPLEAVVLVDLLGKLGIKFEPQGTGRVKLEPYISTPSHIGIFTILYFSGILE